MKKKRPIGRRGHYCWCCGRQRPNETFSGSGHARHLCRDCARKGRAVARARARLEATTTVGAVDLAAQKASTGPSATGGHAPVPFRASRGLGRPSVDAGVRPGEMTLEEQAQFELDRSFGTWSEEPSGACDGALIEPQQDDLERWI